MLGISAPAPNVDHEHIRFHDTGLLQNGNKTLTLPFTLSRMRTSDISVCWRPDEATDPLPFKHKYINVVELHGYTDLPRPSYEFMKHVERE